MNVSVEINRDIDKFKESVVLGLTAKQLIASVLSILVGGTIVVLTYKKVGFTLSAYIAIPIVAPIALSGFYSFNGMSFMQMMKKRIKFMFKVKPLVYKSTENVKELKDIADVMEEENQKSKNNEDINIKKTKQRIQEHPDSIQPVRSRQITEKAAEAARGKQEEENDEDYGISDILSGNVKKSVYKRVFDADFDERITVVNLLLSGLTVVFSDVARERKMVQLWYEFLKEYRKSQRSLEEQHALYNSAVEQFSKNMEILKESSLILPKEYYIRQDVLKHIKGDFDTVMDDFTEESEKLSTMEDAAGEKLNHAFDFVEDVFSDGQEMLVFVTELTITPEISSFLAENECEKFDIYNEKLMVGSNRTKLLKELER